MTAYANIIGGGLAGSEAALVLARAGVHVRLVEQRPKTATPVHKTGLFAELVCSNSLKSTKPASAAGMLKSELELLGSPVYACACAHRVAAGGALAVDRDAFAAAVTQALHASPFVTCVEAEAASVEADGSLRVVQGNGAGAVPEADAVIVATGPLTSEALASWLQEATGSHQLAFYDAAAPIVMADSIDGERVFRQSRYGEGCQGDYLNAPFTRDEYDRFIDELVGAQRVIARDFERRDLFQACQPIEEIARKGHDAPRFGPLKPVGLIDPRTGKRPWAALQLRAEDAACMSFNLVGFQTNLTFPEQRRVFRLIPGLEHAEFARYGVMHRNTYVNAPAVLDARLAVRAWHGVPLHLAGQLSGTEGYCEAIRSGHHAALCVLATLRGVDPPPLSAQTAFGALIAYATDPATADYQPMHVNFGIMPPLAVPMRAKQQRYEEYARRGGERMAEYAGACRERGLLEHAL